MKTVVAVFHALSARAARALRLVPTAERFAMKPVQEPVTAHRLIRFDVMIDLVRRNGCVHRRRGDTAVFRGPIMQRSRLNAE
jgi:hypothetical protein